jgi:hypothetical protein
MVKRLCEFSCESLCVGGGGADEETKEETVGLKYWKVLKMRGRVYGGKVAVRV